MEHAIMCPQCNAPLEPHPFARSVICSYCGATIRFDESSVTAATFHEAFRLWNSPLSHHFSSWISFNDSHWALEECIAHGESSDVYTGRRARWPTELVIVKLLRERQDAKQFDNEWESLQILHRSEARGADTFTALLPQPILHGNLSAGQHVNRRVSIFRRESGFRHTIEEVIRAYPQGIPPRASIWVWRRILEVLSFIHASGMVHGAVLPPHLLIQDNEHGIRLVGYGCAGKTGEKLQAVSHGSKAFYPCLTQSKFILSAQLDLAMSARCIAALLGGDPETTSLPASIPEPLAGLVQRIFRLEPADKNIESAWVIREALGDIAQRLFGSPQFIPIVMPS